MLVASASVVALPLTVSVPAGLDAARIDPRLTAFGLYASQSLKLNDGVRVWPWRMGSGGTLWLGVGALACANTFVVGDFTSSSASGILGDVRLGGSYIVPSGALQKGAIVKDASLAPLRLALDPLVLEANTSAFVEAGTQRVLYDADAYPRDVTVRAKGTLVLVGEAFRFRSLVLNAGAKLILRRPLVASSTALTISVAGELLVDGAVMASTMDAATGVGRELDGRSVLWMYHGASELHLNGSTRFLGTLAAPNSKVSIASNAGFLGSLWARAIEIHQYNQSVAFLPYTGDSRSADTDVDNVPDTLEFRLGTDPLNADTDGDGYTDGLEIHGRQGLMGALKGVTAKAPRYAHSWGWALDTTRRDLFNPLRRDLFLRLVWQKDEEIRQMVTAMEMKWDTALKACTSEKKYPSLFRGEFTEAWADSAWLDRLVEIFADPSDKPLVEAPHSSRVPDYTATIHVDAGASAWRNLDSGLTKFGGAVIVASGGTNHGFGPYDFDLNGDGRLDNYAKNDAIVRDCQGVAQAAPFQNERDSLVVKLFRGWTADPFRDSWGLAVGYGANGRGTEVDKSQAPHHAFITSTAMQSVIALRGGLLHEYGHTLGPSDLSPIFNILQDGIMNYSFGGSLFQRCNPTRGATYMDTRYCGEEPLPDEYGLHNNLDWEHVTRYNVSWTDTVGRAVIQRMHNPPTKSTDTLLYVDGGPLDRRTGFRKMRGLKTNADLRYSRGIYCALDLSAMDERTGISICADGHGTVLATPIPGTPIDWNQNGVIDEGLVDLWGPLGSRGGGWFIGADHKPWFKSNLYMRHSDSNDWVKIMLQSKPFIGAGDDRDEFKISEIPRTVDLKDVVK